MDRRYRALLRFAAEHLERIEQIIDFEDKACPCCGVALQAIGEDVSERLDVGPTTFPGPRNAPAALPTFTRRTHLPPADTTRSSLPRRNLMSE